MALLKLSALITAISGKIAGQTIINGAQGFALKNNGNISKVASSLQQTVRINTANITQLWRSVPLARRQDYANQVGNYFYVNRVGETKQYNAYQIFNFLSQGRRLLNLDPPNGSLHKLSMSYANIVITNTSVSSTIIQATTTQNNQTYVVWFAYPISKGSTNVQTYLRKITTVDSITLANGFNLTPFINSKRSKVTIGSNFGIAVQPVITATGDRLKRPQAQISQFT
jgi:hypothetical protein